MFNKIKDIDLFLGGVTLVIFGISCLLLEIPVIISLPVTIAFLIMFYIDVRKRGG